MGSNNNNNDDDINNHHHVINDDGGDVLVKSVKKNKGTEEENTEEEDASSQPPTPPLPSPPPATSVHFLTQPEQPLQFVGLKHVDDPYHERHDQSYELWVLIKSLILLPLALVRIVLIVLIIGLATQASSLILYCNKSSSYSKLTGWPKRLFDWNFIYGARLCMFILGVYYINQVDITEQQLHEMQQVVNQRAVVVVDNGTSASGSGEETDEFKLSTEVYKTACDIDPPALVVCNHMAPFDPFLLKYTMGTVTAVAKAEAVNSLIGGVAKNMEVLFVDKNNKRKILEDMYQRTRDYYEIFAKNVKSIYDARLPPLIIFPEGTTTSGAQLLRFNTGAFRLGAPVAPIILRFPYKYFNFGWTSSIPSWKYFLFHYTQLHVPVTVVKFPKYIPNERERKDSKFYSENVRRVMAHGASIACPELPPLTLSDKLFSRYYGMDDTRKKIKSE